MASELYNNALKRAREMKSVLGAKSTPAQKDRSGWDPNRSDEYNRIRQKLREGKFYTTIQESDVTEYFEKAEKLRSGAVDMVDNAPWYSAEAAQGLAQKRAATWESSGKKATQIRQWAGYNRSRLGEEQYQAIIDGLDNVKLLEEGIDSAWKAKEEQFSYFPSQKEYDDYQEYLKTPEYFYYTKYGDMTKEELAAAIAETPHEVEKKWLQDYYAEALRNEADYDYEIAKVNEELGQLQKDEHAYHSLTHTNIDSVPKYAAEKERYNEKYGSWDQFKELQEQKKTRLYNLQQGKKYDILYQNADFEENSTYSGGGTDLQEMVNDPDWADGVDTAQHIAKYVLPGASELQDLLGYEDVHLMTDDERKIFNYLHNTQGEDAARGYMEYLQYSLNARSQQKLNEWVAARTKDIPVLSQIYTSILSTPIKLLSGEGILDAAGQKVYNSIMGKEKPIDYNRNAMAFSHAGNTIRSSVAQQIYDGVGGGTSGKLLSGAYNLGMSMQDSGVVAAATAINPVLGKVASTLLSSSAATDSMIDAAARGADDWQALTVGMAAGFFEYFFEKYEIESLMKQGKNFGTAMIKQGFNEFVGEGATEVCNILVDAYVMAEKSNWQMNINKYLQEHPEWSQSQAKKAAMKDAIMQVVEAGAAGFISGGLMGGGAAAINTAQANHLQKQADTSVAKGLVNSDGSRNRLMELAMEVAEERSSARMKSKIEKAGNAPTVRNIRNVYRSVSDAYSDQIKSDVVKSLKRKGFSRKDANALGAALTAEATGVIIGQEESDILRKYQYDSRLVETRKNLLDNDQSTVGKRLGNLSELQLASALNHVVTQKNMTETAAKRLTELGETESVDDLAAAAAKSAAGQKLTAEEKKLLKQSEYGTQIVRELKKGSDTPTAESAATETPSPDTADASTEAGTEFAYEASDEGVAIRKDTGAPVKIKEVAAIKNGTMTLRMEDGSEIDASNIGYSTEAEAVLYETISKIVNHADAANLLIGAFKTADVSAYDYAKGIIEAHYYGKYNLSEGDMLHKGTAAKNLTPHQRKVAYEVGQIFGGHETAKEHASVRKAKGSKTNIRDGKVHFDGDRDSLNETQRASMDVLDTLAKALGVQIYIYDSTKDTSGKLSGKNGWYDLSDGSIHIDLNAGMDGKGTILFTAAHELTHFIRQWSPAKFKVLANFLISQYYEKGVSVQELIDGQIAKAKRNDRTIDRDTAYEEVVADSMETMLTSGNVLEQLAELRQRDKTLWEKIKGWFKDFANKLKAVIESYKGVKPDSVEGRLVSDMQGVVEILEALYADALLDASANYAAGVQKNTAGGGVKYQLNAYSEKQIENWKTSKRIVVYNSIKQLDQFISDSIADNKMDKKMYFGAIPSDLAKKILAETGINVENYNLSLGSYEVRKILKDHGNESKEAPRGQRAVVADDFAHITDIVLNSNKVVLSEDKYMGKPAIVFTGDHNGRMNVVAVVSDKRLDLFIQTVFVNVKKGNLATPIGDQAPINTPKASSGTASFEHSIRNSNEVVNKKSSTRDPAAQKLQQALEKENAKLKEDMAYLKELLAMQRKVTGGTKFTRSSVTAAAQMLKKNANAKGDTKELAELLNTFYEYIATEKELTWEGVKEQAQAPVQWLQDHVSLKQERSEYAQDVLRQIRGSRVYLDESQKAEAAYRFGSFGDFRKSMMGSITIVKDGNTSLDSFWQEMSAAYPDIFNKETASGDMPGELFDIIGRLRNSDTSRVEYEYNRDLIAVDLLQDVYDSYWRVSALRTYADTMQKKINVLRYKHKQQMSQLRSEKNAKIDSIKAEYRAELERVRKEHKADTEAKVQDIRDKYTAARERSVEDRKKTLVKNRIKNFKKQLEHELLRPTDKQYIPINLTKAMVDVCELIDDNSPLYKKDGTVNKAQAQREATKKKLLALADEYNKLKTNTDPVYSGEFDEMVYVYLDELRKNYSEKSLDEMSLDELREMHEILQAIKETLQDARKLIGWGDAEGIYEAGTSIIAEQRQITADRRNGKRSAGEKARDYTLNLSLSPVRNVERMSGYHQDSYLLQMFKRFEKGVRKKNKFRMDAYKQFEPLTAGKQEKQYFNAIHKEVKGISYVDAEGRKFGVSKMQMMQAILSFEREVANNMGHIPKGGFTFADLKLLSKGKLKEAVSAENSHRVSAAVDIVGDFVEALKDDRWCQDYMSQARTFFDGAAKDAVNETSLALKHRIIAKDKNYIPFEVDEDFVNREISAVNNVQETINSYGMLKATKGHAPQPLIITGLNNILDRHIEQVGNLYGLGVEVRNFNKVWNFESQSHGTTVKKIVKVNWGDAGVDHIEQAVKDIQGPRSHEHSPLYDKVKGNYIGATFLLNLSVVTKQIGSMYSATSMLKWRDPIRMIGNLVYTMARGKKISAEVDQYTASAWMRRQGMSDEELYTLMTQAKKPGALRVWSKAPALVNPAKWITAMDHAVALSLWKYAKIDTRKRTGLEGEELLKATAEFYDEVIENTQSMTDVLHRPEVQKRKDIMSETFGMFKTDLFQMAGQLQNSVGRFKAEPNKDNAAALGKTLYATLSGAIWGQLMTTLWALFRYKVNPFRDEDDEELTVESWLKRQGFALVGDLAGYILPICGSEIVGIFERIEYGESGEAVESIGLSAINGVIDTIVTVGTAIKDGEMPKADDWKKISIKCLQAFGVPANNIIRTYEAIRLHATDIANGEFLSFEAGVDRSPKHHAHRIIEAADAGNLDVAQGLYDEAIEETAEDKAEKRAEKEGKEWDGSYSEDDLETAKSELKTALGTKFKDGEVDEATVMQILSEIFGESDNDIYWILDKWNYAKETGSSDGYSRAQQLYDAMLADDDAAVEELKGSFVNDKGQFSTDSYQNAIRKGLRENEPRIQKAAEAKAAGDTDTYLEIVEEIVDEGHFNWKDVSAAVKDEVKEMKEEGD